MSIAAGIAILLDVVIVTQGTTPSSSHQLRGVALASPRPAGCDAMTILGGVGGSPGHKSIWDTVREPRLRPYCDQLARGYAALPLSPEQAHQRGTAAGELLQSEAAPWILCARASSRLGLFDRAASEFERARTLDAHALDEPAALRDWAAVLARAGRKSEAMSAYRSLGPRLSLVYTADQQVGIWLEAAALASSCGPGAIDDAVAFLEEARRGPPSAIRLRVLAELALALDRRGDGDRAQAIGDLVARRPDGVPVLTGTEGGSADVDAAVALLSEAHAPRAAIEMWSRYLRAPEPNRPWLAHATRHRDALVTKVAREARR